MNVKSLLLVGFVLICSYALDAQPKLPKWVRKVNAQIENGDFKAVQTVPTDSSFWNLPYQLRKDLGANYFSAFHLDTLSNGIEVLRLMKEGHGTTLLDRLISGRGYALFYKDDQVLKVLETYTNNSRMGSCGHLEITHEAYFKGNEIAFLQTMEEPFQCYGDRPDSILLEQLGHYFLEARKYLAFKQFLLEFEAFKETITCNNPTEVLSGIGLNFSDYRCIWVQPFMQPPYRPGDTVVPTIPMWPLQIIGDRYMVLRLDDGGPPMGIQPYTTYYFERIP